MSVVEGIFCRTTTTQCQVSPRYCARGFLRRACLPYSRTSTHIPAIAATIAVRETPPYRIDGTVASHASCRDSPLAHATNQANLLIIRCLYDSYKTMNRLPVRATYSFKYDETVTALAVHSVDVGPGPRYISHLRCRRACLSNCSADSLKRYHHVVTSGPSGAHGVPAFLLLAIGTILVECWRPFRARSCFQPAETGDVGYL